MKRKKEKEDIISLMISIYCKKNHTDREKQNGLCLECADLKAYSIKKDENCYFKSQKAREKGLKKTFCSNCRVHCYQDEYREKIKSVMRFSGKYMLLYRPKEAFSHICETIKFKLLKK